MLRQLPRLIAVIAGVIIGLLGAWALIDPQSFYDQLATWPPYNGHFLHDVGAFQIGIGTTLVLAAFLRDPLFLGLTGAATGSVLHTISHVIDGDRSSDVIALGLLAAVLALGAVLRYSDTRPV